MDENFLLYNETAKKLYSEIKDLPIFDYHCHLDPKEIYENRVFNNLTELWLKGDHYKWRVMRNAGVNENLITGDASDYEKFFAFASVLPNFAGNPVYHWAHLELKKYFGITTPLSCGTAKKIWDETLDMMKDKSFCAQNLISKSNVDTIFTTDDPISDLKYHALLQKQDLSFKVAPSFRSDRAINIEKPDFVEYMKNLSEIAKIQISDFSSLVKALKARLEFFIENGCVIADLSFTDFPSAKGDKSVVENAFKKKLSGENLSMTEISEFKFCLIKELAFLFSNYDITMQLHTGVERNVNKFCYEKIGADCGFDSVGNAINIAAAGNLFSDIENESRKNGGKGLPHTIVYTLNANSYYPLATMIGDFAGNGENFAGKMQLGAAWWFMDHKDGIAEQLKIFAATSGLGFFNGMLTDSRSFVSYARHDYFRRILSSVIGEWIEKGEYPDDENAIQLVKNIAFFNAKNNFGKIGKNNFGGKK